MVKLSYLIGFLSIFLFVMSFVNIILMFFFNIWVAIGVILGSCFIFKRPISDHVLTISSSLIAAFTLISVFNINPIISILLTCLPVIIGYISGIIANRIEAKHGPF